MRNEMLIVEDVLLLMLDDETGVPARTGALHLTLGCAVLVDLALLSRVEIDEAGAGPAGPEVRAVGDGALPDRLLQSVYDKLAERPRGIQSLLPGIGGGLWKPVIDRLIERGLVRRESKRLLGVFRTTSWPAEDTRHEDALRQRISAVLEGGQSPDARTAAVIALLSASGALTDIRPALPWSDEIRERAKNLEQGSWGAAAVNAARTRTAAAIAVSSATMAITTVT
ncbi:GOLPH3/VPS74 family protein [Nocardia sp. NBC_00416]|uniref:GOLPH3/VPS74 family protein n=1 Tax=Nocardia sp. NBC_00416 TaxID=2975991 RepID=UPI002E1B0A78